MTFEIVVLSKLGLSWKFYHIAAILKICRSDHIAFLDRLNQDLLKQARNNLGYTSSLFLIARTITIPTSLTLESIGKRRYY